MKSSPIEEREAEARTIAEPGPISSLLDKVAEPPPPEAEPGRMALPSGRVVEARAEEDGRDRLTIKSPSGEVELEVVLTERGPLLRFRAADVELESTRDVKVKCRDFQVRAEGEIVQESGGDLRQRIGGNASVKVRKTMTLAGREARLQAKRGNVEVEANDDVVLLGERIKLNC